MGQSTTVFVLLLAVLSLASAAQVSYLTSPTYGNGAVAYGQEALVTITADGNMPATNNTITITCNSCSASVPSIFFPASAGAGQTATFTFVSNVADPSSVTITFTQSGLSADFAGINAITFRPAQAQFTVTLNNQFNQVVGDVNTGDITIASAPVGGQSITATISAIGGNSVVVFTPNQFTWLAGQDDTRNFEYRTLKTTSGEAPSKVTVVLSWTGAGGAAAFYAEFQPKNLTVHPLTLDFEHSPATLRYGQRAFFKVSEDTPSQRNPVQSLTITPTSAGAVFTPTSVTLNPTQNAEVAAGMSMDIRASGEVPINLAYSGADWTPAGLGQNARWATIPQFNITVNKLSFSLGDGLDADTLNVGEWNWDTAELDSVPINTVTVTPGSDNGIFTFEPATFTFNAQTRSVIFRYKVNSFPSAPVTVWYTLAGADAVHVNAISNDTVSDFARAAVYGPPTGTFELAHGQTSASFPIGVSVAPTTSLTVWVNVSGDQTQYTITPQSFTFTSSSALGALFTITAAAAGGVIPSGMSLVYTLTGTDAANYAAPTTTTTIETADPNYAVVVPTFSDAMISPGARRGPFTVNVRGIPPSPFSVTLASSRITETGAVLSFEPATLNFNSNVWSAQFWVVCNPVTDGYSNSVDIDYTITPTSDIYSIEGATSFAVTGTNYYTDGGELRMLYPTDTVYLNPGDTQDVYFFLKTAPLTGSVSVTLSLIGFTLSTSTLTWAVGENLKKVTVTAGNVPTTLDGSGNPIVTVQVDAGRNTNGFVGLSNSFGEFVIGTKELNIFVSTMPQLSKIGVPSAEIPVHLSGAPTAGVSITLAAPGLTFSPNPIVFAAGQRVAHFTYTAASVLPGATVVTFTPSAGADIALYLPGTATIPAPTLGAGKEIEIKFVTGTTHAVNEVFYGYANLNDDHVLPNGVTVTPQVPAGSNIVFKPASFVFTPTTVVVPFEVIGTSPTWGVFGSIVNDDSDWSLDSTTGVDVHFAISGSDAALFDSVPSAQIQIFNYVQVGFLTQDVLDESPINTWQKNKIVLHGNIASAVTLSFHSSDSSVEINPASVEIAPNTATINTFDVAFKASTVGVFQVFVDIAGLPASFVTGPLVANNYTIFSTRQSVVSFETDFPGTPIAIGEKIATRVWLAEAVGSVTITAYEGTDNIVWEPKSVILNSTNPSAIIWAHATATSVVPLVYEFKSSAVSSALVPWYHAYIVSVASRTAPVCTFHYSSVKVATSYKKAVECTVDPVTGITITPSGRFLTFSPATRSVVPGETVVLFDMQVSAAPIFSRQTLAGDRITDKNDYIEVAPQVVFGGADFDTVLSGAAQTAVYDTTNIYPRILERSGVHDTSNPAYWGNTISIQWAVDAPITSTLVLTPTTEVAGLAFVPTSVTLVPGASSASFSLYLDPEALFEFSPANKFHYTVAVSGGDVNSTYCPSGNCDYGYGETVAIQKYSIDIPSMPGVTGFNSRSADWTITLPIAAINGLTLTPSSTNYQMVFTPAAFEFTAGETSKTVSYVVEADKNGGVTVSDTPTVRLVASGGDIAFFEMAAIGSPITSNIDTSVTQYGIHVNSVPSSVSVGEPFKIEYAIVDETEHTDVTEVVITPVAFGVTFTPASVTLSNANPQGGVVGVVNTLAAAYAHMDDTADESVVLEHLVSGADSAKFGSLSSDVITVTRFAVTFDAIAPGDVTVGTKYGPYQIVAEDFFNVDAAITVSLRAPEGFTFEPANTFTFNATNRREYFYFTPAATAWTYGSDAEIVYSVEGATSDYYTVVDKIWFTGPVFKRAISAPSVDFVTDSPTFYSFTFDEPVVNGLTITPQGNNLVFTPAEITVAAGATEASFSVYTTASQSSTITYTLGGDDAAMYSAVAASAVLFDGPTYEFEMSVDGSSSGQFTNRYGFGTITVSVPPRTYLTVVPQSTNGNVQFTPAVFNFTSETTKLAFRYQVTSFVGKDYVSFSYSGPELAWYAYNPLPIKDVSLAKGTMNDIEDVFSPDLKVGVPRAGVASLPVNILPAAGKSVTFTPWCTSAVFEPASFTFDANTPEVHFTVTATYMATNAYVVFTVDDDENYDVPDKVNPLTFNKAAFVTGLTPQNVISGAVYPGDRHKVILQVDAPVDVQITPVTVGPITFKPAVWDFSASTAIEVEVSIGSSYGNGDQTDIYVSFLVSGDDAELLSVTDLTPVSVSVTASNQIVVPGSFTLTPGQVVTKIISIAIDSDNYELPEEVTVSLETTGLIVNPTSLTIGADNQWAAFTVTLVDGFVSGNSAEIRYSVVSDSGSKWEVQQSTSVSIARTSFILPNSFSAGPYEEWIVGAKVGPFTAAVQYATIADVTLTPVAKGLTFVDADDENVHELVFSADRMFVDFYIIANALQRSTSIQWTVSGADASAYTVPSTSSIDVINNYFNVTSIASYFDDYSLIAGAESAQVDIFMQHPITDSSVITLTPSAAGLIFNPASLVFDSNNLYRTINVSVVKHISDAAIITFDVSVSGGFAQVTAPLPIRVYIDTDTTTTQEVSVPASFTYTLGAQRTYQYQVTTPAPVKHALTVQASAPGVEFTPAVIAAGTTYARFGIISAARPTASVPVTFTLTGDDAAEYTVGESTIVVTGKTFSLSTASFATLYPGVESTKYTLFTAGSNGGASNGGAPSAAVVVTPWAAGVTFTPATFEFSATTTAVDFTIKVDAAGVYDKRTVHFTISGPSALEYAPFNTREIEVSRWVLTAAPATVSTIVGYKSTPISVGFTGVGITSTVTVTPVAYGVEFTPSSVQLSPDNLWASFVATPQFVFAAPDTSAVTFKVEGDIAKYIDVGALSIESTSRKYFVPSDLGYNYVGVESTAVSVSLDYLPVTGSVIITPQAAGTVFSPASFEFTATSAPYTTFKFTSNVIRASIKVDWVLTGTESQSYARANPNAATTFSSNARPIDVTAGARINLVADQTTWVQFTSQYVPPNGITISFGGALTFDNALVSLNTANPSARVGISGGALGATTTAYYTLGGEDAWMYTLGTTSQTFAYKKYSFTVNTLTATLFNKKPGQPSAPFTFTIPAGFAGESVTLIPSSNLLEFTPSVFTFDANTLAVTGTYTISSQAAQRNPTPSNAIVGFAVAGPAAALFQKPGDLTVILGTTPQFSNPYNTLTVPNSVSAVVGVESSSFRVYVDALLAQEITVTPYVADAPGVVFNPASAVISGDNVDAFFTVTAGFRGAATIDFQVSGPGAYLFNTRSSSFLSVAPKTIIANRPSYPNNAKLPVYRKSAEYTVNLDYAPASTVTITFTSTSGAVDIYPPSITLGAGVLSGSYYIIGNTYSALTTVSERITYTLSGPDAQYYALSGTSFTDVFLAPVTFSIVGLSSGWASYQGDTDPYVSLNTPLPSDVSVQLVADGFTFSPNPVVIPAGDLHGAFSVAATTNGYIASAVVMRATGIAQGSFAFAGPYSISTQAATYAYTASFTSLSNQPVGRTQSVSVTLSEPALSELTFRCESALFEIPDLVIPVGHSSATVNTVPTVLGVTSVTCQQISNSAFTLSGTSGSWSEIRISGNYFSLVSSADYSVTVGGWSVPVDFGLFSAVGASAAIRSSLNVSFIVSPAGAAVIDPPALYITAPASSFNFRLSPRALGRITVTPVLSGEDAALFAAAGATPATFESVHITGVKRNFAVMSGNLVNRVTAALAPADIDGNGQDDVRLIVGEESDVFTVYVEAPTTDLAISLEAPGIVFNPPVLRFTGAYESLTFTMTATAAYGDAVYVHFILSGADAPWFNSLAPQRVYTHHKFLIPDFPILTINQPQTLQITLASNFSAPVLLFPTNGNVVFLPEALLFTPEKPTVTFQVIGVTTTAELANNYNPVRVSATNTRPINPTQSLTFSWRYMYETGSGRVVPFLTGRRGVNVLPAGFVVNFPHLQIGQTSTLTVTATVAPRSDVVLTLIGNNLNFNPPSLLFTASNTVATTAVTPVHADYQSSQNIPFTVDYLIAGTNQADYIPPTQSFLAVSRGTAPQADSMLLSAASPAAFASVFLVVASLIALLL